MKMKPEENSKQKNQGELFRNRLDQIIGTVVSNSEEDRLGKV
ncbi:hypothetical protein LEP1GSC024_0369 [Leptospira noguchii str. 2001034031]|uniref:Uncharacterized protein n=1 Tax=Leptospira noguchii str. 2001034031 TaxID=1193053 RepID=M6YWF5_9LEPT|nr:hypothetical protein LEP1GSC024_0369 [Leptospira noguchii str. 2001034031]